ncbi:MAG: tetratricopeptide repeat protein [Candidatus Riflebacteria bacterium]|nr:tetratricopeptide repeat protein [Candidatus Riflebacteria bacterium]
MRRFGLSVGLFCGCLLLFGFAPGPSPDLRQYSRLPLSVKLARLVKAGEEKFQQRRYEEAIAIFEVMKSLDEHNLDAIFWLQKCNDRLSSEANERMKAQMIKQKGNLVIKESLYDNWVWGPTVGHFEIRQSKPKPHIPVVRKVHPRASDAEIEKARKAADAGDANALFELAMVLHSRADDTAAIEALDKAVTTDPTILERDDEGLSSAALETAQRALEKGTITPEQRLRAARVNYLQGDLSDAVIGFIKAASKDSALKGQVQKYLQTLLDSRKADFLLRPPEVFSFRQAYLWEKGEDSLFIRIQFRPTSPHFIVPFDLPLEPRAVKAVETRSSDLLFVLPDPVNPDGTRLWLVAKDATDDVPMLEARLVIRLHPSKVTFIDLSNYQVSSDLSDNWSVVIGDSTSFGPGFPVGQIDQMQGKLIIKGYRLQLSNGKGPSLDLRDFRKNLGSGIDPWKIFEDVLPGG